MLTQIQALLDRMRDCAAESFFAAERFGKNSQEHLTQQKIYRTAAQEYEAACRAANRNPYRTYDID